MTQGRNYSEHQDKRLIWWRAPRRGHNVDMMAGTKTETQGRHNSGHQDGGHKTEMMAVIKTGNTRKTQRRSPRPGTQVRRDGLHKDRGHKVDMMAVTKTVTQD